MVGGVTRANLPQVARKRRRASRSVAWCFIEYPPEHIKNTGRTFEAPRMRGDKRGTRIFLVEVVATTGRGTFTRRNRYCDRDSTRRARFGRLRALTGRKWNEERSCRAIAARGCCGL